MATKCISYYDNQIYCENLDSVSQLEIGQAGYLFTQPHTNNIMYLPTVLSLYSLSSEESAHA